MERASLKSIIRGTKAELNKESYIFPNTIVFLELDTGKIKFADGKSTYKDIEYVVGKLDEADGSIFKYKGVKETLAELYAIENPKAGDCWDVKENGKNYAWNGNNWDDLGGIIDLSEFATKEELHQAIEEINNEISSLTETVNSKANISSVYNKTEIDTKFNNYTTTADLETILNNTEQSILHEVDNKLENYQTNESANEMKAELETEINTKIDTDVIEAELADQVKALKDEIAAVKLLIPNEVFNVSDVKNYAQKNGKLTLENDINLETYSIVNGIFAKNITTINLNRCKLSISPTNQKSLLMVRGSAEYTFNGNGIVENNGIGGSVIWTASANCTVSINSGEYIAHQHSECIYCEIGTININGGIFKTGSEDKRYLLNCKDTNYKAGTAKIIVKGGEFWDFDPHNCDAEGAGTNFCADGYTTTSREEDGHTIYTVIKA